MSEVEHLPVSRPPNEDEKLWFDVRREAVRQSVPRLNEAIGRLLTLATALAGGVLAFLKDDVCPAWYRVAAGGCFFVALAVAAWGAMPTPGSASFGPTVGPDLIRSNQAKAMEAKVWFVRASLTAIVCGLLVALVGTAVRAASL